MNYGEEHRSYRETNIHEHSSRSHTIFQVYVESKHLMNEGRIRFSVLNLIDLAGSERMNEFDVRSHGEMSETGHINKSLFALSNVIKKLGEGSHVPYRNSKLTRIVANSLGGNAVSAILCTVSPALQNYHETITTLRFANNAKLVKNRPKVNEMLTDDESYNSLKCEVIRLKEELSFTRSEMEKV
jgi:centromeric protein E